jgi:hypothetical protein
VDRHWRSGETPDNPPRVLKPSQRRKGILHVDLGADGLPLLQTVSILGTPWRAAPCHSHEAPAGKTDHKLSAPSTNIQSNFTHCDSSMIPYLDHYIISVTDISTRIVLTRTLVPETNPSIWVDNTRSHSHKYSLPQLRYALPPHLS